MRAWFGVSGARGWLATLLALSLATVLIYAKGAFLVRHGWGLDPFTIDDDTRQFLTWAPRIADPALLPNDLLADYWYSVTPWLYRVILDAASALGVGPVMFARLLPCVLLPLTALSAWWLARGVFASPAMAFFAAVLVLFPMLQGGGAFSPTPRAFAPALLLVFLGALIRDRGVPMVVALFCLASIYPASALVAVTILGLSRFHLAPRFHLDLSRRSILLVLAGAAAVAIGAFPFVGVTEMWHPTLTLAEARDMPVFMDPDGRMRIVLRDGSIGWFCGRRIGFLPPFGCKTAFDYRILLNLLLIMPSLVLLVSAVRSKDPDRRSEVLLYGTVTAACVIWYGLAAMIAFKIHLPSRYSHKLISLTEMIGVVHFLGPKLQRGGAWLADRSRAMYAVAAVVCAAGVLAVFLLVHPGLRRPAEPEALKYLASLPPQTLIGGFSDELAFIPALIGRSVLASPEHAIPYHLGYYREVEARLRDMLRAATDPDPRVVAEVVARRNLDIFAVDTAYLRDLTFSKWQEAMFPAEIPGVKQKIANERPALLDLAADCVVLAGKHLTLLDGHCLVRAGNVK